MMPEPAGGVPTGRPAILSHRNQFSVKVAIGPMKILRVRTEENLADLMTKWLTRDVIEKHLCKLNVVPHAKGLLGASVAVGCLTTSAASNEVCTRDSSVMMVGSMGEKYKIYLLVGIVVSYIVVLAICVVAGCRLASYGWRPEVVGAAAGSGNTKDSGGSGAKEELIARYTAAEIKEELRLNGEKVTGIKVGVVRRLAAVLMMTDGHALYVHCCVRRTGGHPRRAEMRTISSTAMWISGATATEAQ